jgi:hypothetical protein
VASDLLFERRFCPPMYLSVAVSTKAVSTKQQHSAVTHHWRRGVTITVLSVGTISYKLQEPGGLVPAPSRCLAVHTAHACSAVAAVQCSAVRVCARQGVLPQINGEQTHTAAAHATFATQVPRAQTLNEASFNTFISHIVISCVWCYLAALYGVPHYCVS